MKPVILVLFLFVIVSDLFPQQIINEEYLFLNSDVSSNAMRYNPAILGQGEKFNATLNAYYNNNTKGFNRYDVSLSFGNIGIGYDYQYTSNFDSASSAFYPYSSRKTIYSLSLGFGNKKFSFGTGISIYNETFTRSNSPVRYDVSVFEHSNFYNTFSALYKPNEYLSLGGRLQLYCYKSNNFNVEINEVNIGAGLRPFGNDRLSLYFDVANKHLKYRFDLNNLTFKAGAEVKVIDGLRLGGLYSDYFKGFNIGFNFGNFGISSNTIYTNRITHPKTHYSTISLQYFHEKRDNIIPKGKSIMEVSLSGGFQDFYSSPVLFGFLGNERKPMEELISTIYDASDDDNTSAILLRIDPISSGSRFGVSANLEELGNALLHFRSKNKKVISYISETAGIAEYYLANFTDKIVMPRDSYLNYGLSVDVLNYKQFLSNIGIELDAFYAGDYKLTFQGLLDSSSAEGEKVINRILDIVYDQMLNRVSVSRNIPLNDGSKKLLSTPLNGYQLLTNNLIDKIGWYEDARSLAINLARTKNIASFETIYEDTWKTPDKIAVIGIYGTITPGESSAPPLIRLPINIPFVTPGRTTGSKTILKQLESAFSNPEIKSVVLRVNSGGGSALASAEIYDAIKHLKNKYKKPFVVSMGNAAASGGYFVSAGADRIFGSNSTVTGSIGVFGAFPKLDSLMSRLKIKAQNYSRGEMSDINSPYVEFTEEQVRVIQDNINYLYDNFISSIADARKLPKEYVAEVSQGIVWLGKDALDKKLIDEIGGMKHAINYAKKLSGINRNEKVNLVYYPVAGSRFYELEGVQGESESGLLESVIRFLGF